MTSTVTPDAPLPVLGFILLAGGQPAEMEGQQEQAEENQGEGDAGGQGAHGAGTLAAILMQEEEPGEQADKYGQKEEHDEDLEEHGRHPLR